MFRIPLVSVRTLGAKQNGAAERVVMITQPASNMRWPRLVRLIPDRRLNRYNSNIGSTK